VTQGDGADGFGPPAHGRPADPYRAPQSAEHPPGTPPREIPIGVPESPEDYAARKRAAARPDAPDRNAGDAQVDYGGGEERPD
jgi:hypothetical protein